MWVCSSSICFVGRKTIFVLFEQYAVFCLIGVLVGVLSGLVGVGGGIVLVPTLHSLLLAKGIPADLAFHMALATSMACIVFTSSASMLAHHRKKNIVWSYVRWMAPMMCLGSLVTTLIAIQLNAHFLAVFFALFCLSAAYQLAVIRQVRAPVHLRPAEVSAVALLIGTVSALVSIGGGTLTVPYLNWRAVPIKQAIGTSAVLGLPIALASSVGYALDAWQHPSLASNAVGLWYLPAILLITPLSMWFAPYGVTLSQRLPVNTLERFFALILVAVSIKLLWSQWFA